ncbi:MAG: hypothetical protein DMG22_13545, partial [Acidobacteria bacterium]
KAFQKIVSDDKDMYTYIVSGSEAIAAASPPKPEAADLFGQAQQAYARFDFRAAIDLLKRSVNADPNYADAWSKLGLLELGQHQTDEALGDFRKAIAADPTNVSNYQILAFQLGRLKREHEAIDLWRDLLKREPNQKEAHANLGALLMRQKSYDEAIKEYKVAIRLFEPNYSLEMQLGAAYLEAGANDEAVAAYEKAAEIDPRPLTWNNVAYALAERKLKLPEAERFATQAVQEEENQTARISLDSLTDSDLRSMDSLASYWDTLGWVYFQQGDYEEAEKYVGAAWDLEQVRVIGEHLGQIYEALGKKVAASRQLALARSLPPGAPVIGLPPGSGQQRSLTMYAPGMTIPTEELSQMRRAKLGKVSSRTGSAEFWVLFGQGAKIEQVKFISGQEAFRPLEGAIRSAKFKVVLPDAQAVKLLRRGILVCEGSGLGCDFTLLPLENVRSVQ